MNNLNYQLFFMSLIVASVLPSSAQGQSDLTAGQIIQLMRASSEQYRSISSKITYTLYEQTEPAAPRNLIMTDQIISYWTPDKSFARFTSTHYPPVTSDSNAPRIDIATYAISPKWSKRLDEAPDGRRPRGTIKPGRDMESEMSLYNIYDATWNIGIRGFRWEDLDPNRAIVQKDEQTACYIMKIQLGTSPKGSFLILHIDPSKDYIPVKQELLKYDGTVKMKSECTDFRKLSNGLWVPGKYNWHDPQINYFGSYEFENIAINEPIADNLLDFEFPVGTIVHDQRIGSTYQVGKTTGKATSSATGGGVGEPNKAGATVGLATDEQLRSAAAKGRELLASNISGQQAPAAIEVRPQFVYVKPDTVEYTLSVKSNEKEKPKLSGYSFEGDKLSLSSLKDQIADQGKLVVSITRQEGHSGFAKGLLHLEFSKGKVDITFVSPPIISN